MSTSKNILRRVGVVFVIQRTNVKYAFLNPFSSLEALSPVGRKKIQRRCPCGGGGGVRGGVLRISRDRSLEVLFQRLFSIVYTTLSFNLNSIIVILSGVIVEKLCLTGLQKLQNCAARVLTFSRYDTDTNRLFRQLNWKDLSTQFQDRYPLKC